MQRVEIKVTPLDKEGTQPTMTITVEGRRGDIWNREMTRDITPGQSAGEGIMIRPGQRIVLDFPHADEELVIDHAQSAAIRPSAQQNENNVADAPKVEDVKTLQEADQKRAADQKATILKEQAAANQRQAEREIAAAKSAASPTKPTQLNPQDAKSTGATPAGVSTSGAANTTTSGSADQMRSSADLKKEALKQGETK